MQFYEYAKLDLRDPLVDDHTLPLLVTS